MSTPSMPEPFKTVQDAIIAKLADDGITCHDHRPVELYGVPSAYLVAADVGADYMRAAQGEVGIGSVTYRLQYFVDFAESEQVATAVALGGVRKIFAALAAGTLGGKVRACEITDCRIDPIEWGAGRRPMLMVDVGVMVRPAQYA